MPPCSIHKLICFPARLQVVGQSSSPPCTMHRLVGFPARVHVSGHSLPRYCGFLFTGINCCIHPSPPVSSTGGCLFVRFAVGGGVDTIASSKSDSESTILLSYVSDIDSTDLPASDILQVLLLDCMKLLPAAVSQCWIMSFFSLCIGLLHSG